MFPFHNFKVLFSKTQFLSLNSLECQMTWVCVIQKQKPSRENKSFHDILCFNCLVCTYPCFSDKLTVPCYDTCVRAFTFLLEILWKVSNTSWWSPRDSILTFDKLFERKKNQWNALTRTRTHVFWSLGTHDNHYTTRTHHAGNIAN